VTPKLASPIDLRDLAREERTALVALIEYMVEANANVTDEEAERISNLVHGLGPDPPFVWTKPAEAIICSHRRMIDRISTAVY